MSPESRLAIGLYTGTAGTPISRLSTNRRRSRFRTGSTTNQPVSPTCRPPGTHALRLAGYQAGEFVAIVGQGIIGQTAGLVARMFGARTIAVDVSDERLALAKRLGAHLTINPLHEKRPRENRGVCGAAGLDIAIDTASTWRSYAQSLDLIRKRGRIVLLGIIRDRPTEADIDAYFDAHRLNFHSKEAVVDQSNDAHDPTGSVHRTLYLRPQYRRNSLPCRGWFASIPASSLRIGIRSRDIESISSALAFRRRPGSP